MVDETRRAARMEAVMKPARKDFQRNADLAAIHVAINQLGIDDSTYRAMLSNLTHGRIISAADATADERRTIIEHLRKLGFKKIPPRPTDDAQDRLARSLWLECVKAGAIRDRREKAFLKFAKRVTGIDRLEWMNAEDANKLIEALKSIKRRKEVAAEAEEGGAHR
jgi:phage gp16-like protein